MHETSPDTLGAASLLRLVLQAEKGRRTVVYQECSGS
jgi:hypothetical protein